MHVIVVFAALPLFLGALISQSAYAASYQVQWTNFAAWLMAAGLVVVGFALLWALYDTVRRAAADRPGLLYLAVLFMAFGVGFATALVQAKDAWAAMPAALWLSAVALLALLSAGVLGWQALRREIAR